MEVMRLHVLANSDSDGDQQLNVKVKDGILEALSSKLSQLPFQKETAKILEANMNLIIETAQKMIGDNGYNYPVSAVMATTFCPTKTYGDVTLSAGNYDALNVTIGNGSGLDWWCVLFPPLCFVNM